MSDWPAGNATPNATPGGTIVYSGSLVELDTAIGATAINSRCELRDCGHHLAPAVSKLNIAKHSFYFKYKGRIIASNPDTLVMAGVQRSHADGLSAVDRCVAFTNGTPDGTQSVNWVCVCRKGANSGGGGPFSTTTFTTTLATNVVRTLEIYISGRSQKAVFIIDGTVVFTSTTDIQPDSESNPAFIGISLREPQTKFDGITGAANPTVVSKVRIDTLASRLYRPGYIGTMPVHNPW
jgi:hypothetical protein